jgi:outer membrane protein assembly factor BamB
MNCRLFLLSALVLITLGLLAPCDGAEGASLSEAIAGPGGVTVVLGYDSSSELDAVFSKHNYTVQILEADPSRIAEARKRIDELGCSARVSVMRWSGKTLPYASNLINAVIVLDAAHQVSGGDITRVLMPRGVLVIKKEGLNDLISSIPYPISRIGTGYVKFTKPVPSSIDDWTHYLHSASGNAVANDSQIGPPVNMQWCVDSGSFTRDHDGLSSMSSMVSCNGIMFYILDEGPTSLIHRPSQWTLIARDAFNGTILWKRPISDWVTHLYFFRSGPTWLPRRLVAMGDRVYATMGLEKPISALDAATGSTLLTYEGTQNTEEFVIHDDHLFAVTGDPAKANRERKDPFSHTEFTIDDPNKVNKQISAYDLDSGHVLWTLAPKHLADLAPLSLCAHDDHLYYLDSDNLHCVSINDGKEAWKAPFKTKGSFLRSYSPTVVATNGAVLCLINERLAAFSAQDGRLLWEKPGYIGFASPADLFVIGDLVWTLPSYANRTLRPKGGKFLGNDGKDFLGIDIMTGQVIKQYDGTRVWPSGHHHRCYRNKATTSYFICGRRGVEFINLADDSFIHNWWIRGACQYGVMPANGLLYVPPDPCQCFSRIKLNGLLSFTSEDTSFPVGGPSLVKGPAFDNASAGMPSQKQSDDWPTYRHDMSRSGFTEHALPASLETGWKRRFDGPVSAVTASGNHVYLAEIDAHKVHCLDSDSGEGKWSFVAGARVDSPPTFYGGMVLFGCRDGWVYALRASDGALTWKFRAAPEERFIVEDGQIESSWPVSGSVLVVDDIVYFAAGRSSYLYKGMTLYGLNPITGEVIHKHVIASPEVRSSMGGGQGPPGALPSLLTSDGNILSMRAQFFAKNLNALNTGVSRAPLLLTQTGFLNDSWFHRESWSFSKGRTAPTGKLIVFNEQRAYVIQNPYSYLKRTPGLWHEGQREAHHQQYALYERDRFPRGVRFYGQPFKVDPKLEPKPIATTDREDFNRWGSPFASSTAHHDWTHMLPMQVRAMVLSGTHLYAAGWRDQEAVSAQAMDLPGNGLTTAPAALYVFDANTGKPTKGYALSARPVFDGMAVAKGKLFVSLSDGTLVCFKKK